MFSRWYRGVVVLCADLSWVLFVTLSFSLDSVFILVFCGLQHERWWLSVLLGHDS